MKDNQAEVEEVEQNADDGVHKVEVVAVVVVEVVVVEVVVVVLFVRVRHGGGPHPERFPAGF